MKTFALNVNEAQARLLLEMLKLPQITVPFPKAENAAGLYLEAVRVVDKFDQDASDKEVV